MCVRLRTCVVSVERAASRGVLCWLHVQAAESLQHRVELLHYQAGPVHLEAAIASSSVSIVARVFSCWVSSIIRQMQKGLWGGMS